MIAVVIVESAGGSLNGTCSISDFLQAEKNKSRINKKYILRMEYGCVNIQNVWGISCGM